MPGKKRTPQRKATPRHKPAAKRPREDPKPGPAAPRPPEDELLSMPQAIEMLKTTRATFYRWLRSGKIQGMKVGRQWRFYRDQIGRFLRGEEPRIALAASATPLLEQLTERFRQVAGRDPGPDGLPEDPVERANHLLLHIALRMRATDVHIEPTAREDPNYEKEGETADAARIRLRIDGVLHPVAQFDHRLLPAVVEHWKRLAGVDVHEKVRPQDGRILMRVGADDLPERSLDIRLCVVPAVMGEALTMRFLRRDEVKLDLDRIEYSPPDRERILRSLHSPWGMLLVTGPTGTGKTTVLYSWMLHLNSPEVKIMSVEDPVEFLLPGIIQIGVRERAGVTFASSIRSMLRSAPNVIMVGEIRDRETLQLCFQSALTGHLVMTTLHAETAVAALGRMVDMGCEPFLIADATRLVLSQRLVRKVCPECSVPEEPSQEQRERLHELTGGLGGTRAALPREYRKAVGCPACGKTGYRGQTVAAEVLEITPEIAKCVRSGASAPELQAIAIGQGMTTMAADGIRRAAEGQTTIDEVLRVLARS